MSAIAIIPARGGSKRIPRKNIKLFNNKPMIAWTIERAIESELFEHILVTTDDSEIASVSKNCGATVQSLRLPSLSDDQTTLIEVINYEANKLLRANFKPSDLLCCLYPVSPLLDFDHVKLGLDMIKKKKVDFVLSVKEFEQHPLRAFEMDSQGLIQYKFAEYSNTRTQDLRPLYTDAGQFTIAKIETWAKTKTKLEGPILPVLLGKFDVIDIDDAKDWDFTEEIHKIRNSGQM